MIEIRFSRGVRGISSAWVRRVLAKTLKAERAQADLSVLITGDSEIRKINKTFLKHDYATDVISFETGDVVVSADTAKRMAKELGISSKEELARYLVHGLLHLLGYDDKTKKDFTRMHARQERILKKIC